MKKMVYEVVKYVIAESAEEAIKKEKSEVVHSVYLTKHSSDLLLDELHRNKDEQERQIG